MSEIFKIESIGNTSYNFSVSGAISPNNTGHRSLTEKERYVIRNAMELAIDDVLREAAKNDPKEIQQKTNLRTDIEQLFEGLIYVEEIPNEYCSRHCCAMSPWFMVTTQIGRFKIGWRKRVIHLEWTETKVTKKAEELFPAETTTRFDKIIHAWGYPEAKKYIETITAIARATPPQPDGTPQPVPTAPVPPKKLVCPECNSDVRWQRDYADEGHLLNEYYECTSCEWRQNRESPHLEPVEAKPAPDAGEGRRT